MSRTAGAHGTVHSCQLQGPGETALGTSFQTGTATTTTITPIDDDDDELQQVEKQCTDYHTTSAAGVVRSSCCDSLHSVIAM